MPRLNVRYWSVCILLIAIIVIVGFVRLTLRRECFEDPNEILTKSLYYKDGIHTRLHIACVKNDVENVKRLLENGADVNARDNRGQSPLFWLMNSDKGSEDQRKECLTLLLQYGADLKLTDNSGYTALHLTVACNTLNTTDLLLKKDSNPNAVDNDGNTPLHLLLRGADNNKDATKILELLLNAGADPTIKNKNNETPQNILAFIKRDDLIAALDRWFTQKKQDNGHPQVPDRP